MTATIGPASTPAPGLAPSAPHDDAAMQAAVDTAADTAPSGDGEHPLAKLGIGDLHRLVQAFAPPGSTRRRRRCWHRFKRRRRPGPRGRSRAPAPAVRHQDPNGPGPQVAPPVKTAPPMELRSSRR